MNKGRILITGADGSLGKALFAKSQMHGWQPFGIMMHDTSSLTLLTDRMDGIGKCDAIINCHGINHLSWIGTTGWEDAEIVHTNLMVPYWVVNHAVRMRWGPCRVVNVASQTYRVPQRCTALYAASKAGLVQLTKVMARELAPSGWVINAVSPGKMHDTVMSDLTDAQVRELRGWTDAHADKYALSNIPAGRFTNTDEISNVIFQTLQLPDYVNGTVIEAHGGV
jgi:NAD(P)-dependent dehydrogenase (short-subunit alcohol dehydrogenase family)